MKTVKKVNKGHTITPAWAITIGVVMCIAITILSSIVSAFIISNEHMPQESIYVISALSQIISAFIGCIVATILSGRMPAVVSAITCAVYVTLLICTNILFMDGELGRVGAGVISILFGGSLAVVIKLLTKSRKKIKKMRVH